MKDGVSSAPKAFWQEISAVVIIKAAALLALYFLFFASPPHIADIPDHVFQAGQVK